MAHIGKLGEAVAGILQFPLPTVRKFARVLRDEKMISKKGHGRGADHATALDAARLIIALMVTPRPAESAEVAGDFGALVLSHASEAKIISGGKQIGGSFTLAAACGLPKRHRFDEAVAAILSGFAEERFVEAFLSEARRLHEQLPLVDTPQVSIGVHDTGLGAKIRLGSSEYHYTFHSMVDVKPGKLDAAARQFEKALKKYRRGIHSFRQVDIKELRAIAAVLNGKEIDIDALLKERVKDGK